MPNHVIRDRMWESRKLAACTREAALAYPWIFLVADAWGRFEFNPRRIWTKVFGNREDVSLADVTAWLAEYEAHGLLFRYHVDGDLAAWSGFYGRKASERHPSQYPDPTPFMKKVAASGRGKRAKRDLGKSGRGFRPMDIDRETETDRETEAESAATASAAAPVAIVAIPKPTAPDWNGEFAEDFRAVYGGPASKQLYAQVKDVAKRYGWGRTRPALRDYMAETAVEFLNIPKVLPVRIEAGDRSPPMSHAARQRLTTMNKALKAGLLNDKSGVDRGIRGPAGELPGQGSPGSGDGEAGRELPARVGRADR